MSSTPEKSRCPDGGACHHGCAATECFRVIGAGPLSGVFPGDRWPAAIKAAYGADNVSHAEAPRQVFREWVCSTCNSPVISDENGTACCPRCRVVWDRYADESSPATVLSKDEWARQFGAPKDRA